MKIITPLFCLSLIATTSLVEAGKPINADGNQEGFATAKGRLDRRIAKVENQREQLGEENVTQFKKYVEKQELILIYLTKLKAAEASFRVSGMEAGASLRERLGEEEIPSVKAVTDSFSTNQNLLNGDLNLLNDQYNAFRNSLLGKRVMVKLKKKVELDGGITYTVARNPVPDEHVTLIDNLNSRVAGLQGANSELDSQVKMLTKMREDDKLQTAADLQKLQTSHQEELSGVNVQLTALKQENQTLAKRLETLPGVSTAEPKQETVTVKVEGTDIKVETDIN